MKQVILTEDELRNLYHERQKKYMCDIANACALISNQLNDWMLSKSQDGEEKDVIGYLNATINKLNDISTIFIPKAIENLLVLKPEVPEPVVDDDDHSGIFGTSKCEPERPFGSGGKNCNRSAFRKY